MGGSPPCGNSVRSVKDYHRQSATSQRWPTRSKHKPSFLFLSETKQQFDFVQSFQFHFGYYHIHTVDSQGRSGGLALYYDSTLKVDIISSSNRIIDVVTKYKGKHIFCHLCMGNRIKVFEIRFERG